MNQLNLGINHVICFEAMEIKKCLQEMRNDRLNSSTVARPKFTLCVAKINLKLSNIPELKAFKKETWKIQSQQNLFHEPKIRAILSFFQFIVGKERGNMKVC